MFCTTASQQSLIEHHLYITTYYVQFVTNLYLHLDFNNNRNQRYSNTMLMYLFDSLRSLEDETCSGAEYSKAMVISLRICHNDCKLKPDD